MSALGTSWPCGPLLTLYPLLQNTYRQENYFRIIFGALTDRNFTELYSGSGKSPPLPPQEKGLLPESGSYRNNFQWTYFQGSCKNFLVRAPGRLPNVIVIELFWYSFPHGGGIFPRNERPKRLNHSPLAEHRKDPVDQMHSMLQHHLQGLPLGSYWISEPLLNNRVFLENPEKPNPSRNVDSAWVTCQLYRSSDTSSGVMSWNAQLHGILWHEYRTHPLLRKHSIQEQCFGILQEGV